jgi:hypothetical protein
VPQEMVQGSMSRNINQMAGLERGVKSRTEETGEMHTAKPAD